MSEKYTVLTDELQEKMKTIELPDDPELVLKAADAALNDPEKQKDEWKFIWAAALVKRTIEILNERRQQAGCGPDEVLCFKEDYPLRFCLATSSTCWSRVMPVVLETRRIEIMRAAKREYQPKFEQLKPRVEALYGWMEFGLEAFVALPRDKYNDDQRSHRTFHYGLCEGGLYQFITDLKKWEEEANNWKKQNDAELEADKSRREP